MTLRYYSSTAVQTTGSAGINATQTTMTVGSTAGWPTQYPFVLILDENAATEELVDVSNVSGLTVTMTRGVDGTAGQNHGIGFPVRHGVSGRDYRDSRSHEAATSGVHGVSGNIVDDATAQTLAGPKTLASPLITGTFPVHAHTGGTDGGTITALTNHIAATTAHGTSSAVVGVSDTQNLSNKTLLGAKANPADVNSKGFLVKGLVGQVDNISEVQSSDGTPRWWVDAQGRVNVSTIVTFTTDQSGVPTLILKPADAASIPLVIRGATSQSADLLELQDSGGTAVAAVDEVGLATVGGLVVQDTAADFQAGYQAESPGITAVPAIVKGASGQTGNLQEWRDSSGAAKASITADGHVTGTGQAWATAAGQQQFDFGGGNTLSQGIAFPTSRFTTIPIVVVSLASSPAGSRAVTARVSSISSAGATVTVNSVDSSAMTGSWAVNWIAVQMTASSGSG